MNLLLFFLIVIGVPQAVGLVLRFVTLNTQLFRNLSIATPALLFFLIAFIKIRLDAQAIEAEHGYVCGLFGFVMLVFLLVGTVINLILAPLVQMVGQKIRTRVMALRATTGAAYAD